MVLVVGLGNPGKTYERTRHNFGFLVVQEISRRYAAPWRRSVSSHSLLAQMAVGERKLSLLMPQTMMNNSGTAVSKFVRDCGVDLSDILILCDDLDLPFGQLRFRRRGGDGGHNGLASIIQHLGTRNFSRLRMGIGRPSPTVDAAEYVLSGFSREQTKQLPGIIQEAADGCESWIQDGIENVMNIYNKRKDNE